MTERRGGDDDDGLFVIDAQGEALVDPTRLNTHFDPLPGTVIELHAMAQALGAAPDDTETAAKSDTQLASARVVEFATHALFPSDRDTAGELGLVFTPPQKATFLDDGLLTASEVAQMRFSADWLILSACNTATSDGGDSLSSLARAFLFAGARSLLVSEWRVDDSATAALTTETLRIWNARPKLGRAEALQLGMHTIRTGRRPDGSQVPGWRPDWTSPSFWSPFVLIETSDN